MDPSRLGRLPPPFSFQPMHPDQQHQQHQQQHQQQGPSLHNSEDDEYSNSSGHNTTTTTTMNLHSVKGNGKNMRRSSSMADKLLGEGEVVRKPRGRPPGSKNKPKPPIIITRETGTGMRPHVLEIASGCDIHECIATFARRRQRSLCVLGASGTVSNVTLRQPTVPPGSGSSASVLNLHGRFDILSMSGTFMQPSAPPPPPQPLMPMPMPTSPPSLFGGGSSSSPGSGQGPSSGLTISLAGAQGQVIGGMVVGALMSVSPILVIAASFMGPCAERLPLDEHEGESQHGMLNGNNGGGPPLPPHHLALTPGGGPPPGGIPGGSGPGGGGNPANDPCAMSLYNLPQVSLGHQMTPDILAWAAAAGGRPPPF